MAAHAKDALVLGTKSVGWRSATDDARLPKQLPVLMETQCGTTAQACVVGALCRLLDGGDAKAKDNASTIDKKDATASQKPPEQQLPGPVVCCIGMMHDSLAMAAT